MKKLKRPICFLLSILLLLSPLFSFSSFAEDDDKAKLEKELREQMQEHGGYEDTFSTLDTVYEDKSGADYKSPKDKMGSNANLSYLMWRVFRSDYMYDVSLYSSPVFDEGEEGLYDTREIVDVGGGSAICDNSRDGDFLYHNCDIPTVMRSAFQNLQTITTEKPIEGAEKTTAYEGVLGVPANIPSGSVPLDLGHVGTKYTGLEMFGYDLKHTSYNGEWDNVQVNTSARLLSNYGIMDKIKLAGNSIVNGFKSVFTEFLNIRSLNDLKKAVFGIKFNFAGGSIMTLVDTSDANVAATRAWGRPTFAQTTYNGVHYLPNKLVATRSMEAYADFLVENFEKEAKRNKELKPWLEFMVDKLPDYDENNYPTYKNKEEYDKYKEQLEKYNKYIDCKNNGGKICGFKVNKPKKVKLEKYTKEERFELYKQSKEVQEFMGKATSNGVEDVLNKEGITDFAKLRDAYSKAFVTGIKKRFAEGSKAVKDIGDSLAKKFYSQHPEYDVKKEISHWVCTGTDNPSLDSLVDAPYLFTDEYTSKINPACGSIVLRKTIKGGNNGSGDTAKNDITDTRWKQFMRTKDSGGIRLAINSGGFIDGLNKFFVKLTNTLLSFSFDSIIEQSGLDEIMVPFIEELRDGMYFPLIAIGMAITALWMFYKFVIKNFSPGGFLKYLGTLLVVFVFVIFFLTKPAQTISTIEKIPSKMDNLILDGIYNNDDVDNQLCSVSGDKIRAIQCEVWQVGIFNPWLMGQFGTARLSDLDEENMKNTNQDLVGRPSVHFGGGSVMNNWAIYQLRLTKSGSITTKDTKENSKDATYTENSIDPNMFRIVDLQFGPNNADGRDTRFATQWASRSGKSGATLLGTISSFIMLLILGKFLVYKIQLSFSMFLQVMLFPFFALVGMLPNGVNRFKDFIMNFIGLFVKRLTITAFTVILLKFLLAGANSGIIGIPYYIYVISVLLSFNILWKDYAGLIASGIESPFKGNSAGSKLLTGDYMSMNEAKQALQQANLAPRSIDQYLETKKEKLEARTSGAIAGGLIALKTMNNRNDSYITVEKKSIEKDENGNYYIATKKERKKESAFDIIKEVSGEGAKKTENWMYKRHRRQGFGWTRQVIDAQDKLDKELVTAITSGGRTARDASINLAYNRLNKIGRAKGFDITAQDVANSKALQRHISQFATLNDEREVLLEYKPTSQSDANEHLQAIHENEKMMNDTITKIEKDLAKVKTNSKDNISADQLAELKSRSDAKHEHYQSLEYKKEAISNFKDVVYIIELKKAQEERYNQFLNRKVSLTDEEIDKLYAGTLTEEDLNKNAELMKKQIEFNKQKESLGKDEEVKITEEDKNKIVGAKFRRVKKKNLNPGDIEKAFKEKKKELGIDRELNLQEQTEVIEKLKASMYGEVQVGDNKTIEPIKIDFTTYSDLLGKQPKYNEDAYETIEKVLEEDIRAFGGSDEIERIRKEVQNEIKDKYKNDMEVLYEQE